MGALGQVGEDEPLPVAGQHVLAAPGGQHQAGPLGQGLQEEVDLGVVPQGLSGPPPSTGAAMVSFVQDAALVHPPRPPRSGPG